MWLFVRIRNSLVNYSFGYGQIAWGTIRPDTNSLVNYSFGYGQTASAPGTWHGGRAHVQERLGLEDKEMRSHQRHYYALWVIYTMTLHILMWQHTIANMPLCIFSQHGARHYQHVSSDIRCNQQQECSRKGRPVDFMSHINVRDDMS